ncbi:MAG: hypothetical protein WC460_06250 [Patescibacteria group bacterium]
MNYEVKRIKKRKIEDISPEEIDKWREQIEDKIRNMGENPLFIRAANEVLPEDLDSDARKEIVRSIVRELPDEIIEMIKAKDAKRNTGKIFTKKQENIIKTGAWVNEMQAAKIAAGKGRGLRRLTPLPPKERAKKKTKAEEDQLDLFAK